MTVFIICAIISGVFTLYLTYPLMHSRPYHCYFLMILIPVTSICALYALRPAVFAEITAFYSPLNPDIRYVQEKTALNKILKQKPDDATTILDLAGLYISHENYDEAISLLKDAIAKRPENDDFALQMAVAHFAKGLLYAKKGEYEKGVTSLYRALAVAPENAPFLPDIEHFIEAIEKKAENTDQDTADENLP